MERGSSEQALSDIELVYLIVNDDAATAFDGHKLDKGVAQPPKVSSSKFHCMVKVLKEYCQWQVGMASKNTGPLKFVGSLYLNDTHKM